MIYQIIKKTLNLYDSKLKISIFVFILIVTVSELFFHFVTEFPLNGPTVLFLFKTLSGVLSLCERLALEMWKLSVGCLVGIVLCLQYVSAQRRKYFGTHDLFTTCKHR